MEENFKGFVHIFFLITLALLGIGALGYFGYQKFLSKTQVSEPTTYEECLNYPGHTILEMNPPGCLSKSRNGKSFWPSKSPLPDDFYNPKAECLKKGARWLDEYNECENEDANRMLSKSECEKSGAVYEECASVCRHRQLDSNEMCAAVCVTVCKY